MTLTSKIPVTRLRATTNKVAMRQLRLTFVALAAILTVSGCGSSPGSASRSATAARTTGEPGAATPAAGWTAVDIEKTLGATGDAAAREITAISCTQGPFCMVIAGHRSATFDGRQFATAGLLGGTQAEVESYELSCSSARFCMAMTRAETYFTWNGAGWSPEQKLPMPTGISSGPNYLACPADGDCLAIGQDGAQGEASVLRYTAGAWTSTPFESKGQVLTEVACASQDYCHIVGNEGEIFTFNGTSWTAPAHVSVSDYQGSDDTMNSIACAAGPLCIGAGQLAGVVLIDHGSGFVRASGGPPILDVNPGACGSATFCTVSTLGPMSHFKYFDGLRLQVTAQPPAGVAMGFFSCTQEAVCLGSVRQSDQALIYRRG